MNIEELGASNPGELASAIISGLWATAWLAGLWWVGRGLFLGWWYGWPAGDADVSKDDDDKDESNPW